MNEIQTVREAIDVLGGTRGVSELTGAKAKSISAWRTSDRFPWKTYPIITAALRVQGRSAPETLFGMKAKANAA